MECQFGRKIGTEEKNVSGVVINIREKGKGKVKGNISARRENRTRRESVASDSQPLLPFFLLTDLHT